MVIFQRYYEGRIIDNQNFLSLIEEENRVFQKMRENHQGNWKIQEACREILFYNSRELKYIMEEIENDKWEINYLKKEFDEL